MTLLDVLKEARPWVQRAVDDLDDEANGRARTSRQAGIAEDEHQEALTVLVAVDAAIAMAERAPNMTPDPVVLEHANAVGNAYNLCALADELESLPLIEGHGMAHHVEMLRALATSIRGKR